MRILEILNKIEETPATNGKIQILKDHSDNELLKLVVKTALQKTNFYIKKIPEYGELERVKPLEEIIPELDKLSSRKYTGNTAIIFVQNLLGSLLPSDAEVLKRIITHDLRCGISVKNVNKAWPDFIGEYPKMLSGKDRSRIDYSKGAIAQLKMDGVFCHAFKETPDNVRMFSRNGLEFLGIDSTDLKQELRDTMEVGETWCGELTCFVDGIVGEGRELPRKTSSGIMNKSLKGTIEKFEADTVCFTCWDINDYSGTIPYEERFLSLLNAFGASIHNNPTLHKGEKSNWHSFNKIAVVEYRLVHSEEESLAYFQEVLDRGKEGIIVKNLNGKWVNKRSLDLCKFKAELTCELVVVGTTEGNGKYAGQIGALLCESSDGILKVGVGSGLTDADRKERFEVGEIIEVVYNEKIINEQREWSLFIPIFVKRRPDKDVADTFADIE